MKLSHSLRKNLIESVTGGFLNRFKIKTRRDVLFFEDILLGYAKECESIGFGKEIEEIGSKWGALLLKVPVPSAFKKLPPSFLVNRIMKKVFINLGLMDDIILTEKNGEVILKIKNEAFSKDYEGNVFLRGLHRGFLSQLYGRETRCLKVSREGDYVSYRYEIRNKPFEIESKSRKTYNDLNRIPKGKGFTTKDALKSNIFRLKNNRLYFRGRILNPLENTVFHLLSNSRLPLERLSSVSYRFFSDMVKNESKDEEKLNLLKNLLQITCWGSVKIITRRKETGMIITNPPYGFQKERDNWEFLLRTILGYMWTIDRKYRMKKIAYAHKKILIEFSV